MIKITVLIDNLPQPEYQPLEAEHGLRFHIETGNENILLDTGASDKYLHNAEKMDIDIAKVDYLILSHAHNAHTGGLAAFLQTNSKAKIYLSANINGSAYFSTRRGGMRDISIDYNLLHEYRDRFVFVSSDIQLTSSVRIISNIPMRYGIPLANRTLYAGREPDTFNHEMAIAINHQGRSTLLSSCTHLGLLNTLEVCKPAPSVFIGGMHLVDSDDNHQIETENDYRSMSDIILSKYPALQIYTGHCTGPNAQCALAHLLDGQFHTFHTGFEWCID